jgi:hypothetical protein
MKKQTNEERKGSKFIIIVTSSLVSPDIFAFLCFFPINYWCMSDQFISLVSLVIGSFKTHICRRQAYMGVRIRRGSWYHRLSHLPRAQHTRSLYVYVPTGALHSRGALSLSHSSPRNSCLLLTSAFLSQRCWKHDGKCISARERAMSEWCARRADPISNQLTYISSPPFTRRSARLKIVIIKSWLRSAGALSPCSFRVCCNKHSKLSSCAFHGRERASEGRFHYSRSLAKVHFICMGRNYGGIILPHKICRA